MNNGKYRTEAGSEVTVSGEHSGKFVIDFDWLEEGACCDCRPSVDLRSGYLMWDCRWCQGGSAPLLPVVEVGEDE